MIPTYDLKGKPSVSHINVYNKDEVISSEATPSVNIKDTAEEEADIEEIHMQKVRQHQTWKRAGEKL